MVKNGVSMEKRCEEKTGVCMEDSSVCVERTDVCTEKRELPFPLSHRNSTISVFGCGHLVLEVNIQNGSPIGTEDRAGIGVRGSIEIEESSGTGVRAATIDHLVWRVVQSFDMYSGTSSEPALAHTFFLTHRWIIPSAALLERLGKVYKAPNDALSTCSYCLPPPVEDIDQIRKQVCYTIRYWVSAFPVHFAEIVQLLRMLEEMQQIIRETLPEAMDIAELLDTSKIPSFDWMRTLSYKANQNGTSAAQSPQVSLAFTKLSPLELAQHVTCIDFRAIRRVTLEDLRKYVSKGSVAENPRLEKSIAVFNGITQWVQLMVLTRQTPRERAVVVEKFVKVAQHLHGMSSFNSMMAVVGGLAHSAIARLQKTTNALSGSAKKTLSNLMEFTSYSNNFSTYRKRLAECQEFHLPILGIHLKDLIALHTALPDYLEKTSESPRKTEQNERNELSSGSNNNTIATDDYSVPDLKVVNFLKMSRLSVSVGQLHKLSYVSLPFTVNENLVNTLKAALDTYYMEEQLHNMSLNCEPKHSSPTTPGSPSNSFPFADWLEGGKPPDCEVVHKHVSDMVEAVFKTYDTDHDGFISRMEFEAVSESFPCLTSFGALDANKDGRISKKEMKAYFSDANSHALKSSFLHNFIETTYRKPTFCNQCNGLLWGLIKQGWKCKDCGINAHKHCKDTLVLECRIHRPLSSDSSGLSISSASSSPPSSICSSNVDVSVQETHTSATPPPKQKWALRKNHNPRKKSTSWYASFETSETSTQTEPWNDSTNSSSERLSASSCEIKDGRIPLKNEGSGSEQLERSPCSSDRAYEELRRENGKLKAELNARDNMVQTLQKRLDLLLIHPNSELCAEQRRQGLSLHLKKDE